VNEITRIEKVNLNGKATKLVTVREDGVFVGTFAMPARVANKNALSYLESIDVL